MKYFVLFLIFAGLFAGALILFRQHQVASPGPANTNSTTQNLANKTAANTNSAPAENSPATNMQAPTMVVPIAGFFDRVTKKHFGQYITPKNSPVQPERFTGYHTGADAETTPAEQTTDVPVYAIADGTILFVGHVNGYGGFLALRFVMDDKTMIATYGHIRLASATVKSGDTVHAGEKLAVLGTGYSTETDGERKHLHFGILVSGTLDYRGYVQSASGLSLWTDPVAWLQTHHAAAPQ